MSHMTINQRTQFDRVDLSVPTTGTHVRRRRALIAFNVLALAVLGVLAYATVVAVDGWAQGVVLAMIALSPNRRA